MVELRRCRQMKCGFLYGGCKSCEECNAVSCMINDKCDRCKSCESDEGELRWSDNGVKEKQKEKKKIIELTQ